MIVMIPPGSIFIYNYFYLYALLIIELSFAFFLKLEKISGSSGKSGSRSTI